MLADTTLQCSPEQGREAALPPRPCFLFQSDVSRFEEPVPSLWEQTSANSPVALLDAVMTRRPLHAHGTHHAESLSKPHSARVQPGCRGTLTPQTPELLPYIT